MTLTRRRFLVGAAAGLAAPAIVREGLIMPVRAWAEPLLYPWQRHVLSTIFTRDELPDAVAFVQAHMVRTDQINISREPLPYWGTPAT